MFRSRLFFAFVSSMFCFSGAFADTEVVGTTAGGFSVGATGSAQYQIPIFTPPGINSMQPSVGLAYNSRSGNGWAGLRWNLTGFSAITRCGKILDRDNEAGGVTLTDEDRFCLDGQRLVLTSGTYGAQASFYRTEIESGRRITAYADGPGIDGPNRFRVQTPDGLVWHYGLTATSQIMAVGTNTVRVWALSYVHDQNDNRMVFDYDDDIVTGEYHPTKIDYTSNPTHGPATPRYSIEFDFTESSRPAEDQREYYLASSKITVSKRLENIRVKYVEPFQGDPNGDPADPTGGDRIVREYRLNYADEEVGYNPGDGDSDRSYLVSVEECAKEAHETGGYDCFAPSTFDWQAGDRGWLALADTVHGETDLSEALVGDANNDGFQDLFVPDSTWKIYAGSADGLTAAPIDTGIPVYAPDEAKIFDYDGDGHSGLLVRTSESSGYLIYKNSDEVWSSGIATGVDADAFPLDVNGDGLSDVLYTTATGLMVSINLGGQLATPKSSGSMMGMPPEFTSIPMRYVVMNANGDPKQDVLGLAITGTDTVWQVLTSDGSGLQVLETIGDSDLISDPRVVDLNGDGLTDILYVTVVDNEWKVRINNGNGFDLEKDTDITALNPGAIQVTRYDLDDRQDLVDTSGRTVYEWNGTNLVQIHNPGGDALPVIMDVDGDGYGDGVTINTNTNKIAVTPHSMANQTSPADVITKFTDGLSNFSDVTLEPLSTFSGYSQTTNSSGTDDRDISGPLYVVSSYTQNDGLGGTFDISYEYKDAKVNTQGRGFLGFGQTKMIDGRADGANVTTKSHQTYPLIGRPFEITSAVAGSVHGNNVPVESIVNIRNLTWNSRDFSTGSDTRTVVYLTQNKSRDYEMSLAKSSTSHFRTTVVDITTDADVPGLRMHLESRKMSL